MRPDLDAKEKSFYGVMIIGAISGLLEGTLAHGFAVHYVFPGAVLTLVATFIGGFIGFLAKDLFRLRQGLKPYRGITGDGMVLGAFLGALLGTLVQIAASKTGANIVIGSMMGGGLGASVGAFADDFVSPVLALLESQRAKESRPGILARLLP